MSFSSAINTLMNSDTTLNGLVDGIYYSILPDNSDQTGKYVLFTYRISGSEDTIGHIDVLEYYDLYVKVIAPDTVDVEEIAEAVRSLLDEYEDTEFRDVRFMLNSQTFEGEKGFYIKNYEYQIIYQK